MAKRKLGFYSIEFKNYNNKDGWFFDEKIFIELLNYIKTQIPVADRIVKNSGSKKATSLDDFEIYEKDEQKLIKLIFKSCKFNHSPDLMSVVDGSERPSNKKPEEGEKEKTHVLCKVGEDELELILEERKSGVSIGGIKAYFNRFLKQFLNLNNTKHMFTIEYGLIPGDDFNTAINGVTRVCEANLFMHKELLGSAALDITDRQDKYMNDNIVLSYTVKRGESLDKEIFKGIFAKLITSDTKVKRLRLRCKDEDGASVLLDSDNIKKLKFIEAEIDELKGLVNSTKLFEKMEGIFTVEQDE